ncbi:MFS transporter [uncultured Tenacibaculum sp.]|uniref:MFS transporter n=1 Tax=uncultured Tenacibaculum sp. TaxID=174713 RepID=UPI00260F478E|nr:MFS transporter [uncultured Tenacibaculum sp.]
MEKRKLGFWEIWNMSFGFLGIQMGFALQNANASRILQTFGADVHHLSWFWIIAPLMGLIVQPIIGHYSDKTWTKLGRRRPYFLIGAILASIGLVLMPQAEIFISVLPALWVGAGMLMIMDASFNIAMEPFRALVGDNLRDDQKTSGFSIQTVLIGIGAVVGSWLPYALANWFGISNDGGGGVPPNLIWSFIIGAIVLIISILVTVFTTDEYSPEELKRFADEKAHLEEIETEEESGGLVSIVNDFKKMPITMKQLAWVQFFSWFGLFGMWVFTTPAIAQHIYGLDANDSHSKAFNEAGDWVGIIFGVYNLVSAIMAFFLPAISKKIGRKQTHALALLIGGLGLISIYFATDKYFLIGSMIAVGVAWASILSMPYAMLAGAIHPLKMGIYMGIFNFFIVIPQIINALIGGPIVKYFYNGQAIYSLIIAGVSFLIAAVLSMKVNDISEVKQTT